MKGNSFAVEKFARTLTPLPLEREQTNGSYYVTWGDSNLYPNFLLELYKSVPLHQSIVNSKVDYLLGDGIVEKATGKPLARKICVKDTPTIFAQKVTFDYTLFGMFAVGVQYNVFGRACAVYHIPANHIRANRSKTKFWVCNDWYLRQAQALDYDAFKPGINESKRTQVYIYVPYSPTAATVYPAPRYESAITSMVTERLINDFLKDNLEDGFSAAHIISFFKGMPTSKQGAEFTKKIQDAYSGVKGAKYVIDYNIPPTASSPAAPIKVESVDSPDYTAKLEAANKKNESNILTAHQATSRALFGIEQAAGLNGNDLENAFAIFKNVFVRNNRNNIEDGLNALFVAIGWEQIEFKDSGAVIPKTLSDSIKEKVFTINELREIDGKAPRPDGDKYLEQPKTAIQMGAFSQVQEPQPTGGKILTESDFELVKHLGQARAEYSLLDESEHSAEDFRRIELAFDDAADIEDYLMNNDTSEMSTAEIRAAIKKQLGIEVTTAELKTKIARMTEAGIIGEQPEKKPLTRDVKVLYSYDVRPGYGKAVIETTRGFCRKLIGNDRYYTREDIQSMSAIFGYNVFKHCGGWYYNPTKGEAEKQCRHYWKTVRVIKKQNND